MLFHGVFMVIYPSRYVQNLQEMLAPPEVFSGDGQSDGWFMAFMDKNRSIWALKVKFNII